VRTLAKLLYIPTEAELTATIAKFDLNADQKINFDEFVTRLTVVPATDALHRDSRIELNEHDMAELKQQFDDIDLDSDGFVAGREAAALARDAYVPPHDTVNAIMDELDLDGNKEVTLGMARTSSRIHTDPTDERVLTPPLSVFSAVCVVR
jgi:Ca2+-binding EF-hand superfamily protein